MLNKWCKKTGLLLLFSMILSFAYIAAAHGKLLQSLGMKRNFCPTTPPKAAGRDGWHTHNIYPDTEQETQLGERARERGTKTIFLFRIRFSYLTQYVLLLVAYTCAYRHT